MGRRIAGWCVVVVLCACSRQAEPALQAIADIQTVIASSPDASKYVPEQLAEVQGRLGNLQTTFDRREYAAVIAAAPEVMSAARGLAGAAAARKAEIAQALNDQWSTLAASVQTELSALQGRMAFLDRKSNRRAAAGIDLEAASESLSHAVSLWSKAQAAFATGNLPEAVSAARTLHDQLDSLAVTLRTPRP